MPRLRVLRSGEHPFNRDSSEIRYERFRRQGERAKNEFGTVFKDMADGI
jgi:hypothetical protein